MLDIPKFSTSPNPERYLFSRVLFLIVLGILLYLGIYVNYYLALKDIPGLLNWIFIAGIILLITLEGMLSYVKYGQYKYILFEKHLEIRESKKILIDYSTITDIKFKENIYDRIFNTSSIFISVDSGKKTYKIKHISNGNQIYFYLQKMVHIGR
jgi:hypothetical protein